MKVGQTPDLPLVAKLPQPVAEAASDQSAQQAQQGAAASAVSEARSSGVSVTLSTQVRSLEQANRGEAPDIDSEKVAAVRAEIEQGTYVVNAEVIADKLLANAKEMLDRTRN